MFVYSGDMSKHWMLIPNAHSNSCNRFWVARSVTLVTTRCTIYLTDLLVHWKYSRTFVMDGSYGSETLTSLPAEKFCIRFKKPCNSALLVLRRWKSGSLVILKKLWFRLWKVHLSKNVLKGQFVWKKCSIVHLQVAVQLNITHFVINQGTRTGTNKTEQLVYIEFEVNRQHRP